MLLESVFRRDRWIVAGALFLMTALAWAYVLWLANGMASHHAMPDMPGMPEMADMPGMPGMSAAGPDLRPWTPTEFLLTFVMWAVMMAGMMTPSAAPMVLIYTRVARQAEQQGKPLAAAGWFLGGYLLSWTLFSIAATLLQGLLTQAALLSSDMSLAAGRIGGAILIVAGIYQWTPLKDACLSRCRSPFSFIQEHGGFQRTATGSLQLGLRHGLYCIGCCWTLMTLLFVGGVMSIVWIAGITALVLVEKITPKGRLIARLAGIAFAAAGIRLLSPL